MAREAGPAGGGPRVSGVITLDGRFVPADQYKKNTSGPVKGVVDLNGEFIPISQYNTTKEGGPVKGVIGRDGQFIPIDEYNASQSNGVSGVITRSGEFVAIGDYRNTVDGDGPVVGVVTDKGNFIPRDKWNEALQPDVRAQLAGAGIDTTLAGPPDLGVQNATDTSAPTGTPSSGPTSGPTTTTSPPSAVSGGGGGGGGGTPLAAPTSPAAATTAGLASGTPVQIPAADQSELWLIDGSTYVIAWKIPGTKTTLFYNVDNPAVLNAVYQGAPTPDRTFATDGSTDAANWLEQQGWGFFGGQLSEIQNTSDNPWNGVADKWRQKSKFVPWLNDPEVMAWLAEGMIENDGRTLTPQAAREAGLSFTEGKSNQQLTRELEIYAMPGHQLESERSLIRSGVEDAFRTWGVTIDENSRAAVEEAIDKVFTGTWDNRVLNNEVRLFADPTTRTRSQLADLVDEGAPIISMRDDVEGVKSQVRNWVGPAVEGLLPQDWFESWASTLRNDPNGQALLDEALLGLRVAHFGAYGDNPGLRYADIASPVKGLALNTLGQSVDESDPFFLSLVQKNDLTVAARDLRKHGIDTGNEKVTNTVISELGRAFGSQVAGAR